MSMQVIYIYLFSCLIFNIQSGCGSEIDDNNMDIPLIDNQDAPLIARLNTAKLNKALKVFINNQTEKVVDEKIEKLKEQLEYELIRGDYPADCEALGKVKNGVYKIYPNPPRGFYVYCDMETDGGGWTVFQRRFDGSVNFYQKWKAYKDGFGDKAGEYWLGNLKLHEMTSRDEYELYVELEDFENNTKYARYETFFIGDVASKFPISTDGYSGDAGNSLTHENKSPFSTKDRDRNGCSVRFKGAWWYNNCHQSNLNGQYLKGKHSSFADGINWKSWHGYNYSLKKTKMMIRLRRN